MSKVIFTQRVAHKTASADKHLPDSEDTLMDFSPYEQPLPDADVGIDNPYLKKRIRDVIFNIKNREPYEAEIICHSFGVCGYSFLTPEAIADELKISLKDVKRLKQTGMYKLRNDKVRNALVEHYYA